MRCPSTRLSLEWCRLQGMLVDIVERNIPVKPFPIKKDLFGLFDLIAIDHGEVLFIQTTSASNRASRRKKMETAYDVLSKVVFPGSRMTVQLHTWKKVKGAWEINVQAGREVRWDHSHDCIVRIEDCFFHSMKFLRATERKKETLEGK